MTGASIPEGADAVVPVEATNFWDPERTRSLPDRAGTGRVEIRRASRAGDHIRRVGEVVRTGATTLEAGDRIRPGEMGLLLSVGVTEVNVHPLPRVGVLTTGNELVPPGQAPGPGQIPDSNRPSLLAALAGLGFPAVDLGIVPDREDRLRERILSALSRIDFLLTSGGVSVGDHDLTREVLTGLGEVRAYRVAVKPGQPQVFGHVQGIPVFGLPGNPVSSLVVFDLFVLPALRKMAGRREWTLPWFEARLAGPISRKPGRVEFLRVRLEVRDGAWWAHAAGGQGSHDLATLARANGYARLEREAERLPEGTRVPCQFLGTGLEPGPGSHPGGNAVG
jgi:molybdopterin molybdotransferase